MLSHLLIAVLASSPINLYVSPSGSDSNSCLNAARPCASVNGAIGKAHKLAGSYVNAPVTIYVDKGAYYAPVALSDGGAPDSASQKGLVDIEGFGFDTGGSLAIDCAVQAISIGSMSVMDAGTIGGTYYYEAWVQFVTPDGGWGGYAVDAGYAYTDGGLRTDALRGEFLAGVSGQGGNRTYVVAHNNYNTITYIPSTSLTTDVYDATTTFTVFAPGSHFHPYPDGGSTTSTYVYTDLFLGGNGGTDTIDSMYVGGSGGFPRNTAPINIYYCDFADAPATLGTSFSTVIDMGGTPAFIQNATFHSSAVDYTNIFSLLNSPLMLVGSNIDFGYQLILSEGTGAQANVFGNLIKGGLGGSSLPIAVANSSAITMNNNVIEPNDGMFVLGSVSNGAWLYLPGNNLINMGNTQGPGFYVSESGGFMASANTYQSDGGSGVVQCGSNSFVTLPYLDGFQGIDSRDTTNLISLDNGVSWITKTFWDGSDAGTGNIWGSSIHMRSICNGQHGCCVSNY